MKFADDLAKDQSNIVKHGLAFSEAKSLDWDGALSWIDSGKDYCEGRLIALAPVKILPLERPQRAIQTLFH